MGEKDLLVSGHRQTLGCCEAGKETDRRSESNASGFELIDASAITKAREAGASWGLRAD